jgi:NAD kinase
MWIDEYDKSKYIKEFDNYIEVNGGDGTLIRAIHMHSNKNKPFFGIANGTVNFLLNQESHVTEKVTAQKFYLITGKVTYTRKTFGWKDEEVTEDFIAFNDIILGEFNAWIDFNCTHEDNILGKFMGSAVLISTAQGSTGSNKNNHGTILPLSSKNWSVTGVQCNRYIDYVIESTNLEIDVKSRGPITLCVDGSRNIYQNVSKIKITRGDSVEVLFNNIQNFKEKRQQN